MSDVVGALRFYADEDNHDLQEQGAAMFCPVDDDRGKQARAALAGLAMRSKPDAPGWWWWRTRTENGTHDDLIESDGEAVRFFSGRHETVARLSQYRNTIGFAPVAPPPEDQP